jgi:hypothetical protein
MISCSRWRTVRSVRAGRQALIDLELGFPGAMILMTTGGWPGRCLRHRHSARRRCRDERAPRFSPALSVRAQQPALAGVVVVVVVTVAVAGPTGPGARVRAQPADDAPSPA